MVSICKKYREGMFRAFRWILSVRMKRPWCNYDYGVFRLEARMHKERGILCVAIEG